jgi:hypothetical protein
MLHQGEAVDPAEHTIGRIVREVLGARRFTAITAGDVRRTSDFLHKIVDLIRGTGFSIAIFSDRTPPKTLANIFFEIGVALILGKPVHLIWAAQEPGSTAVPSDFVRTEWIRFIGDEDRLRRDLGTAFDATIEGAIYYRETGDIAFEAVEPDLELAFERYKQAILISGNSEDRARIVQVRDRLALADRRRRADAEMATHRARLLQAVREFLALLPREMAGA